jgi:hypothetical protein
MAVESKPLFHPEVMRQQVRSFLLPDQVAAGQPTEKPRNNVLALTGQDSNTWVSEVKRIRGSAAGRKNSEDKCRPSTA